MRSAERTTAQIPIDAGSRRYAVHVGDRLLDAIDRPGTMGSLVRQALGERTQRAMLVEDAGVPAALREAAAAALEGHGLEVTRAPITPSERAKSVETWSDLVRGLAQARLERSDAVVALGGGVIGDVAGFAAASYRRGIPIVQCPTTLLAMVDASIGGKTGINLSLADGRLVKNMAGAFHQPHVVIADVGVLASLPDRALRCGLAECVKHGLIAGGLGDPGLLEWIGTNADAILDRDRATLTELVVRNVRIKAGVVSVDEREHDEGTAGGQQRARAILNLGHTYAHAIEPIGRLSPTGRAQDAPLEHGEAVSLGLVAACAASHASGEPGMDELGSRVRSLLERLGLPTSVAGLPDQAELIDRMHDDKKTARGRLRLILPRADLTAAAVEDPPESVVRAGLDAIA